MDLDADDDDDEDDDEDDEWVSSFTHAALTIWNDSLGHTVGFIRSTLKTVFNQILWLIWLNWTWNYCWQLKRIMCVLAASMADICIMKQDFFFVSLIIGKWNIDVILGPR